jgi:hypothetical protein
MAEGYSKKQEKLVALKNIIKRQTISPKKEQLVITHQYTMYRGKIPDQASTDQK